MNSRKSGCSIIPHHFNRLVGRAMHDHSMLSHGDRVLVAVSGGVDSLLLAWLLSEWKSKAPIDYSLQAVYIDNKFWKPEYGGLSPAESIGNMMAEIGIDFTAIKGRKQEVDDCFVCSRNRRSQLFDLAADKKANKIAMGHHKDDLIETFFLNLLYSGNISTMVPKQELFGGELYLIRPLAYVEKNDVIALSEKLGIKPVSNYCPIERDTKRETVRQMLEDIYDRESGAKRSLFRALSNVRMEYLL